MGDVPPGLRTAADIKSWFLKQYGLAEQELWSIGSWIWYRIFLNFQ